MPSPNPYRTNCHTGIYRPLHPAKYDGDVSRIVYRSSYEHRFMRWCDLAPAVLTWSSEETIIPYRSPLDNRLRRYFVDFAVKVQTKSGMKRILVEIKPERFTQQPVIPKRKTKRFLAEVVQWGVNQAKWAAARKLCLERGWEFWLITEKDLQSLSPGPALG